MADPHLEPGEVVAHVVKALEGPNRWLAMMVAILVVFAIGTLVPGAGLLLLPLMLLTYTSLYRRRLILATDHSLVILGGSRFSFVPRSVVARLPVETPIGPTKGLWLRVVVDGRKMYVVPRSVQELRAADADLES
jgi:hypothetical protein